MKTIEGNCSCGEPVLKTFDSPITPRIDGIRYHYPSDNHGWCIFRCRKCKNVIEETFTAKEQTKWNLKRYTTKNYGKRALLALKGK